MIRNRIVAIRRRTILALISATLAACAGAPPKEPSKPAKPVEPPESVAPIGKKNVHVTLDEHFSLDYELETKLSNVDQKSCYSFITGTLNNHSPRTLARRSVLDFIVTHKGDRLFRDITSPRADIPPGGRAMFTMISSPIHKASCPSYDRIDVSLRKVFVN